MSKLKVIDGWPAHCRTRSSRVLIPDDAQYVSFRGATKSDKIQRRNHRGVKLYRDIDATIHGKMKELFALRTV